MTEVLNAVVAAYTAVGLALSALGVRAWFRFGETRFAVLFLGFLGFFGQGVLLTWGLFVRNGVDDLLLPAFGLGLAGLVLVYFATLGRPRR